MLDNYKFQVEHVLSDKAGDEEVDLLAVKFHYDVVAVHPFPNGNGRHARQMADLLLRALNRNEFTWNETNIIKNSAVRKNYINAIKEYEANKSNDNLANLLKIARS